MIKQESSNFEGKMRRNSKGEGTLNLEGLVRVRSGIVNLRGSGGKNTVA
jgi:hypothetical protein